MTTRVYLAAPFFNPDQLALVRQLEKIVDVYSELTCFSPRREGGIIEGASREERAKMAPVIFSSNCSAIDSCDLVFAVIDGRDVGVTWEIGYAFAREKPIVTFTNQDFGLNVMIRECVTCHVMGLDQVRAFFFTLQRSGLTECGKTFLHSEPAAT